MEEFQRTGHALRGNKSGALPRYIIAFDAETLPKQTDTSGRRFSHTFRLATATSCRLRGTEITEVQRWRFTNTIELWRWLVAMTGGNFTTWIVSHNILFDLIVCRIMERFETGELSVGWPDGRQLRTDTTGDGDSSLAFAVLESPPTIIKGLIGRSQGKVLMLDSLNYFPVPLKTLGDQCGLPKLPMPEFSAPDEDWFVYCQRDSDILFKVFTELIEFARTADFGMFRYTAPAQSMAAYRHRFMRHKVYLHDNADIKRLERTSYFGGRTEVFRYGDIAETVYQLDVNSLFPSVMVRNEFPCVLDRYENRPEHLELLPAIDWCRSVAAVELDTQEAIYPQRTKDAIIYPRGRFKTVLSGPELDHAASRGRIRKVGTWSEYRLAPLFAEFVDSLWAMRQDYKARGNSLYADFAKYIMNSLYGKFAQRAPKWVSMRNDYSGLPWSTWVELDAVDATRVQYRMLGWLLQRADEQGEISQSFVAISSFVTSLARLRMNELRGISGTTNVYYQGVDSLIVNRQGYDSLVAAGEVSDTQLGKLRLQVMVTDGEINGCGDYTLGDKVVLSGRSKQVERSDTGEVLQRKFHASSHLFSAITPTGVIESLEPWQRAKIVRKGTVDANGWVHPFELSQ